MKLPLDIERELIRKLINGDKIAFSHLFSFYKSQVLYYCVHFVKDKEIAEDITQDISAKYFFDRLGKEGRYSD